MRFPDDCIRRIDNFRLKIGRNRRPVSGARELQPANENRLSRAVAQCLKHGIHRADIQGLQVWQRDVVLGTCRGVRVRLVTQAPAEDHRVITVNHQLLVKVGQVNCAPGRTVDAVPVLDQYRLSGLPAILITGLGSRKNPPRQIAVRICLVTMQAHVVVRVRNDPGLAVGIIANPAKQFFPAFDKVSVQARALTRQTVLGRQLNGALQFERETNQANAAILHPGRDGVASRPLVMRARLTGKNLPGVGHRTQIDPHQRNILKLTDSGAAIGHD
ncbi:MoxR-like ATPase [Pseudomonas syringae pv. actinidiae]|uniref:MoxR-like ATPase n=1 Tax=Pseudomonas syringae pv. actinidiae TaxID=103796 RepID=A0A2V0QF35_PSESF|nr:MoxR-like ATPase [Pseudomonas syringae pv. actinidiae]